MKLSKVLELNGFLGLILGTFLFSQETRAHGPLSANLSVNCWAQTTCYGPGPFGAYRPIGNISCQTHGTSRVHFAQPQNLGCSFQVLPAREVTCRGRVLRTDNWGRRFWSWEVITQRCPYTP